MRVLKFRGLHKYGWTYGLLNVLQKCEDGIDPRTVGQFTGLKDATGKEIYEGDVISSYDTDAAVVEFKDDWAAFVARYRDRYFLLDEVVNSPASVNTVKVLGNIYDDPDLCAAKEGVS